MAELGIRRPDTQFGASNLRGRGRPRGECFQDRPAGFDDLPFVLTAT
jgi:hypothetical protein